MATEKFTSIWDAIEDTPEAAANMKPRAKLMQELQASLQKQKGSQASKAALPGITQPRLNDLLRDCINKFSLDALVNLASRAGFTVDLHIHKVA